MNSDAMTKVLHAPYFEHPDLVAAEELIRYSRSQANSNLGVGTIILALLEAHPDQATEWRKRYRFYVEQAERYNVEYPLNGVGWNDYHMERWLILGQVEDLEEIVRRYNQFGQVGDMARWMANSMMEQCPTFFHAFHKLNSANVKPPVPQVPAGGKKE